MVSSVSGAGGRLQKIGGGNKSHDVLAGPQMGRKPGNGKKPCEEGDDFGQRRLGLGRTVAAPGGKGGGRIVANGQGSVNVPKGIYVVRTQGGKSVKISVK